MKFLSLKEFRLGWKDGLPEVQKYLSTDLSALIQELRQGLSKLTFSDNFETFTETISIPASTELAIRNKLKAVPIGWVSIRMNQYGCSVSDGDSTWTTDYVYLKNNAASTATMTVIFFK